MSGTTSTTAMSVIATIGTSIWMSVLVRCGSASLIGLPESNRQYSHPPRIVSSVSSFHKRRCRLRSRLRGTSIAWPRSTPAWPIAPRSIGTVARRERAPVFRRLLTAPPFDLHQLNAEGSQHFTRMRSRGVRCVPLGASSAAGPPGRCGRKHQCTDDDHREYEHDRPL